MTDYPDAPTPREFAEQIRADRAACPPYATPVTHMAGGIPIHHTTEADVVVPQLKLPRDPDGWPVLPSLNEDIRDTWARIHEAMLSSAEHRAAVLEAACAKALAEGVGVVDVEGYSPMATEMVPAGQRYLFPHLEAVKAWIEAGCPPA